MREELLSDGIYVLNTLVKLASQPESNKEVIHYVVRNKALALELLL